MKSFRLQEVDLLASQIQLAAPEKTVGNRGERVRLAARLEAEPAEVEVGDRLGGLWEGRVG